MRLDPANDRQTQFDAVAMFKHNIVVDHETMCGHVGNVNMLIPMAPTFGNRLVARTVTRSTA